MEKRLWLYTIENIGKTHGVYVCFSKRGQHNEKIKMGPTKNKIRNSGIIWKNWGNNVFSTSYALSKGPNGFYWNIHAIVPGFNRKVLSKMFFEDEDNAKEFAQNELLPSFLNRTGLK